MNEFVTVSESKTVTAHGIFNMIRFDPAHQHSYKNYLVAELMKRKKEDKNV